MIFFLKYKTEIIGYFISIGHEKQAISIYWYQLIKKCVLCIPIILMKHLCAAISDLRIGQSFLMIIERCCEEFYQMSFHLS